MKCPRCSFTSFDYNQACPKCGNDLSRERDLMGFPAYQPKSLAILGMFGAGSEGPHLGETGGGAEASPAMGSDAQELLISLDSLSVEDQGPIQFEPESFPVEAQRDTPEGPREAQEDLAITLDDLKEDDQSLIQFEPEPAGKHEGESEGKGPNEDWAISLDDRSSGSIEPPVFELETDAGTPEERGEAEGLLRSGSDTVFPDEEMETDAMLEPMSSGSKLPREEAIDFWEGGLPAQTIEGVQIDDESSAPESQLQLDQTGPVAQEGEREEDGQLGLLELELEPLELTLETEEPGKKKA